MSTKVPVLKVEMSDSAPLATSPVWVDVTSRVRAGRTSRGADSTSGLTAGTASIEVKNQDRYFDPLLGTDAMFRTTYDPVGTATALDIRAVIVPSTWTPADPNGWTIVQQGHVGGGSTDVSSFQFGLSADTTLWSTVFTSTGDLGTTSTAAISSPPPIGTPLAVRFTWRNSDGRGQWFQKSTTASTYKADAQAHTGWTQIGTNVTFDTGTLDNVSDPVEIGQSIYDGQVFIGDIWYVSVDDAIDGTPNIYMDVADSGGASSWTSTSGSGETWTKGALRVAPGNRIRVQAQNPDTSTWHPVFYGWTQAFSQSFDRSTKQATCTITAVDAAGMVGQMLLPDDYLKWYVDSFTWGQVPASWWRNLSGRTLYDVQGPTYGHWTLGGGAPKIVPSLVPSSKADAISFEQSAWFANAWFDPVVKSNTVQNDVSFGFWIQTGDAYAPLLWSGGINVLSIWNGRLWVGGSTSVSGLFGKARIDDNRPHYIVTSRSDTGVVTVWIDGVKDISGTISVFAQSTDWDKYDQRWLLGATSDGASGLGGFTGVIQDLLAVTGTLSDTQAVNLATAAKGETGAGQTGDVRMATALDSVGWPSSWRAVKSVGVTGMAPMRFDGSQVISHLQLVEATEQGRIYASASGVMTFRSRYDHLTSTDAGTSQVTFSDDQAAGSVGYMEVGYDFDAQRVENDITVSSSYEQVGSIRKTDDGSVTHYGRKEGSVSTLFTDVGEMEAVAIGRLARLKEPTISTRPFTVHASHPERAKILGLEIGQRYTFEMTPAGSGAQWAEDQLVEKIEHSFSPGAEWTVTFTGRTPPADDVWRLGVSSLSTDTRLGW